MKINDSHINLLAEGTEIEGTLKVSETTRICGMVKGKILGSPGSEIIIAESAVIEGNIIGDTVIIEGYVRGSIYTTTRTHLRGCGRVTGDIFSAQVRIDFGAYFEGKSKMETLPPPETLFNQSL